MKTERTRAIVLRRTDYGESDRILQLITPQGRRSAIAKGVRKPRSKLAGGIELLAESDVLLRAGRGELFIVSSARMIKFYKGAMDEYDRLMFVYSVLKLVAQASEHVDSGEWYEVVQEVLMAVDEPKASLALAKAWFYLQYSRLMGDELNAQRDARGEPLQPNTAYRYNVSDKTFIADTRGDILENHIKLLRLLAARPLHVARHVSGVTELAATVSTVTRQHAALD